MQHEPNADPTPRPAAPAHSGRRDFYAGAGAWLRSELAWLGRGLRSPALYALLVGALILWVGAWQQQQPYTLDVGGTEDDAFVQHFNNKEPDPAKQTTPPPFTYRWSQATSSLVWPGLGNAPLTITLRLAGGRPAGQAPPVVTATVRGQVFPLTIGNDLRDVSFPVERGDMWNGDLVVTLTAPPFAAPGDPRELGVLVDSARVTPRAPSGRLDVVPPLADLAWWTASLALLWLLLWRLGGSRGRATAGGAVAAGAVALGVISARPDLGLLAPQAPILLLWAYPLALAGRLAAGVALRPPAGPRPRRPTAGPAEAVAAALVLGFLLRVGGMVYPQFLTSDIGLHVHNLVKVLEGTWVWTGLLPNNAPQPYPPLPYLALAPFAGLVPDYTLLLRAGIGLLDATCVLPLAYLGARLAGPRAGAWAALVYALLPAPFVLFSAGVFAYLFAAAVFTWTLAPWAGTLLACRPGRGLWAGLAAGFFLTILSAYGMLIAAASVMALFLGLAVLRGPAPLRRRAAIGAGLLAVAGGAAFAVYYVHFVDIMLAATGGVSARPAGGFTVGGLLAVLARRLGPDLGAAAMVLALTGWGLIAGRARGAGWLVTATVLAGTGFAALSLVAGENIRYPLLFAPFVAVGAGISLSRLAARGRAGWATALTLIGVLAWHLLGIWLPLIFTHYH